MKITLGENPEKQNFRERIQKEDRQCINFMDTYLEFTKNQESTKKIHKWVATSIVGAALERKVWLDMGHFKVYPNLYIIIIGVSGQIKKSTSTNIGVNLLRELESVNVMSEMVTQASLIQQLGEAGNNFTVEGVDYHQSAVYCYAGELIVFLKEVSGTISEILTTFYDCQEKPWIKELKSKTTVIHGPCLNLLGASTPTWLSRAIPGEEMEGGFSSRVVFVVENDCAENFIAWPETLKNSKLLKEALIHDLTQIHNLQGEFQKTPEAKEFYQNWYNAFRETPIPNDVRFKGYYARKPITVLKLAMIYAVMAGSDLMLQQDHIEKAIFELNQIEPEMIDAFGSTGKNDLAKIMGEIVVYMMRKRSASIGHLLQIFHRDISGRELETILSDLVKMGELKLRRDGSDLLYVHKSA